MGAPEIAYRLRNSARSLLERLGFLLANSPPEPSGRAGHPWVETFPSDFGLHKQEYVSRADKVLNGSYEIFALPTAKLGFPPRWNKDPKTGTEAPLDHGKSLNYRDETKVGDIKYLWEINRHLELVWLAQAWLLTKEPRFLDGSRTLLDSWITQNPYPLGVNWASSLEHAVRLLNWSFAWHLLGGDESELFSGEEGRSFQKRWQDSIYQHCHFIFGHLSKYSSANNHLLGEYAGLFVASTTWPLWEKSPLWQKTAMSGLEKQALHQNAEDGGNKEQATWYHHEVADMLLICGIVGRANNQEFSKEYWRRLELMLEFIASIMDISGRVPMIGDSDDATMSGLSLTRDVYRSLLSSGAIIFKREDFRLKSSAADDKTRWLLGDSKANQLSQVIGSNRPLPIRRHFPVSGYYILGDEFESENEIRMITDAGPLGFLSIAAHGHADALSAILSVGGQEILIDPGTYSYHTQKLWRDYFRGTSAHNTIRVDGLDQSIPRGNFLWSKHAETECLEFRESETEQVWTAQHNGYTRLPDPVTHRRTIKFDKTNSSFIIIDSLFCKKSHDVEIYWHCNEECTVALENSVAMITASNVLVKIFGPSSDWQVEIVKGSSAPPLGWVSREFDSKKPSPTIVCKGTINGTSHLETTIEISKSERVEPL
ncbi:heparinase [Pseudohalioglobus lutimaris]|uniref:Heparinase n=2 Tax=Pseudohalioglobus lutimaris TaxID=1737061 RepID=A0A2N5WWM2_9GAMM|nr:heparinase [Pseudohalioglobus lutimaris]